MYAEERHQAIAELVASRGRVAVTELGDPLRRDHRDGPPRPLPARAAQAAPPGARRRGLDALGDHARGAARRPRPARTRARRSGSPARRWRCCPRAAAPCCSTPAAPRPGWPPCCPATESWTVITHAVPIAALLAPLPHVELHLLPGRVRTGHPGRGRPRHDRGGPAVPRRPRVRRHQRHLGAARPLHARPRGGRHQAGAHRERAAGGRADRRHQGRPGAHGAVRGARGHRRAGHRRQHRPRPTSTAFEAAGLDVVRA